MIALIAIGFEVIVRILRNKLSIRYLPMPMTWMTGLPNPQLVKQPFLNHIANRKTILTANS